MADFLFCSNHTYILLYLYYVKLYLCYVKFWPRSQALGNYRAPGNEAGKVQHQLVL